MLSARLGTATVEVQLSGYPFNCAPVPEFAATLERGTLVLTQTPATGPLARCVGVHRMTLDVATPASPDRVKVVDLVGRVFAEAAIPGK